MKESILGLVAVGALIAGPAMAADLPVKAPYAPPPAPVMSWTGCYIHGGVGYGMFNQNHSLLDTETVPVSQITATSNSGGEGWLGRLGGGCDYQFASSWVIGAFGDYDFEDMHGTFQDAGLGGGTEKDSATWHVGGRIGYSVTPSLLAFVSGGYTEARFDQVNISVFEVPPTPIGFNIPAHTFHGWFIGGGTEYALSSEIIPINGLFWRTEYRYDRYQSSDIPVLETASGLPSDAGVRIQPNVQTVTTGLVWRFNFGGYGGGYGATRY